MARQTKPKSKLLGQFKLSSARKPYYYQVYLWRDIKDLKNYAELDPTDDTLAVTCFEPWYVDDSTGQVYINPKLGEIHFAANNWNVNVIAHEVQHAIVHRMRLIWPAAHLIMLDEYADAEEEIAYENGNWVERVHTWLWGLDPNPKGGFHRKGFALPKYLSPIKFPKTNLKPARVAIKKDPNP